MGMAGVVVCPQEPGLKAVTDTVAVPVKPELQFTWPVLLFTDETALPGEILNW
jgi:hypothetical protein